MDNVPSIFLQSKLGAVSALTFDVLNDIDADMSLGLYVDMICIASRKLINQAGSLQAFTGQHKRPILLGPDNCSQPAQIRSKKHFNQIQYSSNTMYEYFSTEDFMALITDLKPSFFILPNPLPLPGSLTGSSLKPSDLLLHCNASTNWLTIPATAKNAFIAVSQDILQYSDPLPKPEMYANYLETLGKSRNPLFLPYLSQLSTIRSICKDRGYSTHIVVAAGNSLTSLLTALQYESVSAITDLVSTYAEQGIAITVPLDSFANQIMLQETQEPTLKQTIEMGHQPKTSKHVMLTYLDSCMYTTDQEPLDRTCSCLGCKRPKAYIRHLYTTHELTGMLLVAAHNVMWMKRFLLLREKCLKHGGPDSLKTLVQSILNALTD